LEYCQLQVLQLQLQILMKRLELRLAIFKIAKASLGIDISPLDVISDDLGCAESVSWVLKKAIGFPLITGTWSLLEYLKKDNRFEQITESETGCIIISATGTGNGKIRGHVGIVGENKIMSSDSLDGIWKENYTSLTWKERYGQQGGMPIYLFRLKV
jgi:hypothetical protein